jgi:hypothetical protein
MTRAGPFEPLADLLEKADHQRAADIRAVNRSLNHRSRAWSYAARHNGTRNVSLVGPGHHEWQAHTSAVRRGEERSTAIAVLRRAILIT